jgi:CRISPR-associated protein Cst1
MSQKTPAYFLNKTIDTIAKSDKELKKAFEEKSKEKNIFENSEKWAKDFEKLIKEGKSLEKAIEYLADLIYKNLKDLLAEQLIYDKEEIKDIIWNKSVNLLNNILLNFQADMKVRGKEVLEKAVQKLYKDIDENTICSFCEQNSAKRITRDTFFFAPAQFNAFWFNEPSIFICPYCLSSNLAITQSLTFLGNEIDSVVIYRPNLQDLENLNTGLKISDIGELTKRIIDYEKLILKKEATTKDLQIIEFFLDPQNPNLEFYMLTDEVIENLLKISTQLEKLYTTYKDSLWGQVKDKNGYKTVNISKELLKYLTQNQKLIFLVQRFSKLGLMAESFRQNNVRNAPVKGFYISVLLQILKMHFILEGFGMNYFEAFKEYGQFLRGKVLKQLSESGDINWNTFNNKIISLSNSFLDASKGNFQQFMETLTRVMISYDAPIDANLLQMIDKTTYKEIATTIALSLMTIKSDEEKSKDKKEVKMEEGTAI